MRGTYGVLLFSVVALAACEPSVHESQPNEATGAPIAAESKAPGSSPSPLTNDPKAAAAGSAEMIEASYPSPILVHRCLKLIANGPADQVESVCKRALKLDPGNQAIRAALSTP